jgi:hypothetical protein
MDFKSLLQSMDAISETVHKGNYGNEYQPDQPRDVYGHKIPSAKKKEEPKKDVGGQSKADKFAGSTGGIQSMLGNKPKGKVGKVSAKRKLKDWIEVVEENQLNEDSTERPYICVHAKKGKCEVKATSSYDAAKKAAAKWGLKGTAGIDSHLADITHSTSNLEEAGVTIKPMPGASQIIGADGKPIGTADMQTANLIKQASEKGTLNLGTDEQGMAEDGGEKWIKGAIKHPGAFSAKAKRAGETTAQYAREKAHAPGTLGKQARLAQTLSKMHHEGVEETDNLDMPANSLDRMNEPNKKFYTNNPNAMRADRERVSTGANTLSDKGHERAGGAYKVRPSDPNKGKVTRLSGSFKNVKESVALEENTNSLEHIISRFKHEVKNFLKGAEMDDNLYDALYDYYMHSGEMPYGVAKARDSDPYEWVSSRFEQDSQKHVQQPNLPFGRNVTDENSFDNFKQDYQTANSPHPLAPNARRNAEIAKVTPQKTPWSKDPIAAATDRATGFLKTLRNPFKESTDMKDKQFESWEKQLNALLTEGLTVSSSTGQQGSPDSVSVTANDEDAQKLLSALRQAGIGVFGGEEHQGSPSAYGAPQHEEEPGHGTETPMSPEVVGDGDDMLALIKKMTGIQGGSAPSGTADADYEEESGEEESEEEVTEGWDSVQAVKDSAKEYMQSTGMNNVHDLDAEAIEYIGNECQINYEEVCKILGCELPEELGPVDGDDEEVEEGNAFTGALAKAKSDNIPDKDQKFKVGNKEYPVKEEEDHAHDEEEMCNECGMMECECGTEEQVEESFANSDDDKAFQDLQYMLQTLAGGMNGPKRSQATGNIQKVTMETTLMKDSTSLLTDWQKLSGIK